MNRYVEVDTCAGSVEELLSIEVTTRCNSDCLHCFARAATLKHSSLSVNLAEEIICEGYHTGYRHLHITGGEPLLWEGLIEALDYALGMGYETILVNTNGTLLTTDVTKRLAACDCLTISVSLEGPQALHDRIRGEGSYRRTVQGIEKALDVGIDLIIFTAASKGLLPELPRFADDLYSKYPSIKHLTLIQLFRITDDAFALSDELLDPEDFLQLVRIVSLLNLFGHRTFVKNNPLAGIVSKLIEMPWVPHVHPLYREGSMIVKANRDMCLSHSSKDSFGKYDAGMIQKVLASDVYQRTVAPDDKTCPSCQYTELCMENGMIRPSEWHLDSHSDVPYCRRVLDRVIP